jgi:hypothetical protein
VVDRGAARRAPSEAGAERPARRPSVLLLQEPFDAPDVAAALEERGFEVWAPARHDDAWMAVRDVEEPPSLLVAPVSDEELASVRRLRRLRVLFQVPILGVTRGGSRPAALEPLRSLGMVGLVDAGAPLETVLFRVEQIVRPRRLGRRHERVQVFFPVEVAAAGGAFRVHYAGSLSVGGLGLLSHAPIEPNTDLALRFSPDGEPQPLELTGRAVYCHEDPAAPGTYRIGLFFYPMAEACERRLAGAVERRLG